MSGFTITITNAGRAALINAQNNGTTAFILSEVGVSTQATSATLASLTALPNERKRLATMAGDVVADDTLHVTIRDETTDAYAVRSFGIYTSTGVLFAVYTQSAPIIEKSSAAMLLLAVDARLVELTTDNVEFGPVGFTLPPASESVAGIAEVASDAEADAGTDNQRFITPRLLKRALDAMSGFALLGHTHDAAAVTSGTFNVARIPSLVMSKITGLVDALAGKADIAHTHAIGNVSGLSDALAGKSNTGHQHAAADIVSGIFALARIPDLAMSKITGLAAALTGKSDVGHKHSAADVDSGQFNTDRIPTLAISKTSGLQSALDGKASSTHTHAWSTITDKDDVVLTSATNLGRTGNGVLKNFTSLADIEAAPNGFMALTPNGSVGTPASFGYFFKMGKRDNSGGWGGLFLASNFSAGAADTLWFGSAPAGSNTPTWTRALTEQNFTAASAADYRANATAKYVAVNTVWGAPIFQTITQNPTLAVNFGTGINFTTTMTGNRTLAAPSGAKPGQSGVIEIRQDGTGGRTLAFDSAWKFQSGVAPVLSTTANARDVLVYTVIASGDVVASLMKDVR